MLSSFDFLLYFISAALTNQPAVCFFSQLSRDEVGSGPTRLIQFIWIAKIM
jgi:hypothetical protein